MAGVRPQQVLRLLFRATELRTDREPSDADLLDRFRNGRDEAAFAALLSRHGPMVLGVCRRLLPQSCDAEDAFQATFLVLVRKAGSISRPELLANWLYGVALRTATKARSRVRRDEASMRPLADARDPRSPETPGAEELRRVLDEELGRLPERYRAPLVLCYLEGQTYAETASRLGWPEGTVSGRLAREMLRARLTRRGWTLSTGAVATLLAPDGLAAPVAGALAETTMKAAMLFAAGGPGAGSLAPSVLSLAQGVLKAMMISKLKMTAVVTLGLTVVGTGAGFLTYQSVVAQQTPPAQRPADPAQRPAEAAPQPRRERARPNPFQALAEERLKAAREVFDELLKEFQSGRGTQDALGEWSPHLLEAELDASTSQEDVLAALKAHLERMRDIEKLAKARFDAGRIPAHEYAKARFFRLEAELKLEQERRRPAARPRR